MSELPLKGIRIIDFTWVVAGPVATRVLADLGAEVIKIERKVPGFMGPRRTGLQGDLNRDKLSVAINMGTAGGIELARRLVSVGDVVIDNFSSRVMRQWKMDYASLTGVKPDIICASMSGLGHTGPRASFVSYGPTLQALSGYTMLMANDKGEPAGYGYSYADMAGGYTGALAVLMALWHRQRTGQGQFIDLSQFEAVSAVIGPALLDLIVNGREQRPRHYNSQEAPAAPHGIYRCQPRGGDDDRWIAIAVRSQVEWRRFVAAIGSPEWTSEPRFSTLYLRMRNQAELDEHISRWTIEHDADEVMALLRRAGIAAGVVANGDDLCARDRQLQERGFWPSVTLPDGGKTRVTGIPFRLSRTPAAVRHCAPDIGQDNDYVFGQLLGLSGTEREQLIKEGAIWP